jgi:glycosyltransferase involved in cell wall biosynthesis
MHVMYVIDSLQGGGAETSLLEVIPGLKRRGVRTSIVTLLADDGVFESRLSALGVTHIRLRRRDPLGVTLELRKLIRSMHPDLVHTTLLFSNLAGRITARTVRTPVVTTLANQDYGPEHRANSQYGAWSVRAVHAADLITVPLTTQFHAISTDVAAVMGRRLRIPMNRIQIVYRGRDPDRLGVPTLDRRLQTRAALSIDTRAPVVLSVGRLDRQKGVETTIDAFRRLLTRVPGALLLVAGRPGNADAVVRAEAQRTPGVHLLGHRTDVPDLMCAADVLSFPSRWEGLSGALVEAMALRLAVVASNISSVAETIGDVGWPLVQPDDGQALANELLSTLQDSAGSEAKKDAGQRRFRTMFTAEAAAEGMAELYQDVLRNAKRHLWPGFYQVTEVERLRSLSGWSRSACLRDRRGRRVRPVS